MRFRPYLIAALCAAACFTFSTPAHAQKVQRCTTLSGEKIYSDKPCEDIGAIDRLPALAGDRGASGASSSLYRGGCSRTLSDLVYQISSAVEAKDVNRLASVYQWSGISNESANRILDRLQAVVNRPLVDIVPVRPQPPPEMPDPLPPVNGPGLIATEAPDEGYPQAQRQPRPFALRLEQTLANGSTPSQTTFGLRRSYNCFWISL